MTSRDFVYWLQGYFELTNEKDLNEEQVKVIKNHLALVFVHEIDPSAGGPEVQAKLNAIHTPPPRPAGTSGGVTFEGLAAPTVYRC